jgi:carboxylesterase
VAGAASTVEETACDDACPHPVRPGPRPPFRPATFAAPASRGAPLNPSEICVPVLPGAEPFHADGGPVGVLLVHGFTGSPGSLRPWAQRLAGEGYTVDLPRLPGHGTTWQECNLTQWPDWYAEVERAFDKLRETCEQVFVFGMSMGGALSLRLAEERGDQVAGLVLVNPCVSSADKLLPLLPFLKHVVGSTPGLSNDIAKPGQDEIAYDRTPLKAAHSFSSQWPTIIGDLPQVDQPLLVYRSAVDHVVPPSSAKIIFAGISSEDAEEIVLANSYHVATLDNDADRIVEGSLAFLSRLSTAHSEG